MNLITADFNWISFALIVVAGIIGMVKSNSRKSRHKPDFPLPDFEPDQEEETEERYIIETEQENREEVQFDTKLPGDYYSRKEVNTAKESPVYAAAEEDEEKYHPQFDIRQAIIGSEILKRPEF